MPFIRIWVHLIFSTKNREKIISSPLKPKLLPHIKENAADKKIYIDFLNCVTDHIHILLSLNGGQDISKIAQRDKLILVDPEGRFSLRSLSGRMNILLSALVSRWLIK
jgi:hypothetical protein